MTHGLAVQLDVCTICPEHCKSSQTSVPLNGVSTSYKNLDFVLYLAWWGRCEYLLQEKGQDFVHQIQARFPRLFEQVSWDCDSSIQCNKCETGEALRTINAMVPWCRHFKFGTNYLCITPHQRVIELHWLHFCSFQTPVVAKKAIWYSCVLFPSKAFNKWRHQLQRICRSTWWVWISTRYTFKGLIKLFLWSFFFFLR